MNDDVCAEGGIYTPLFYVVAAAEAAIKAKLEEQPHPPTPTPKVASWKKCLDAIARYRQPTLRYVLVPYEDTVQLMVHCELCRRDHVGAITGLKIARAFGLTELFDMLMAEVDTLAESPCEPDALPLGPAGAR